LFFDGAGLGWLDDLMVISVIVPVGNFMILLLGKFFFLWGFNFDFDFF